MNTLINIRTERSAKKNKKKKKREKRSVYAKKTNSLIRE